MEREKNNKGLIGALVVIIFLLLVLVGYFVIGKDMLSTNEKDNDTTTTVTTTSPELKETSEDKYNKYLSNLESQIKNMNSEDNKFQYKLSGTNKIYDMSYSFLINEKLELFITSNSFKLDNYKISDNVLNMFLVEEGNGGYHYLYFIKNDGSLNKTCISCLTSSDNTPKVENVNAKYIVNVIQSSSGNEDESVNPISLYIDIDGNIINK